MKRLVFAFILFLLTASLASGGTLYDWSGSLSVGERVYINDLSLLVDKNIKTNETVLVIEQDSQIQTILGDGENYTTKGLEILFAALGDEGYVHVESEKPFAVSFSAPDEAAELRNENTELREKLANLTTKYNKLAKENEQLKQQVSELQSKLKNQPNTAELNAKILNLTRENRELKAQLANLTNQYNAVKAKADFLEQQNDEYRKMIQTLLEDASQKSEQSYIEKAKKEKLVGSVIIKAIAFSVIVVGLIGYGLYRKKRSWELGGL
ncbi:hypothetical protein, conserved, containing leucine zipper motif [Thermococcus kodakarensis KOD1]|uniref:Uncharacterized protein n=1 Tax=Thermococcus kodakarensis (strain ATCC BAA-918 / JCM 12380 / KOD1) TaxID=69014 RepID=Q5JFB3_THEKO|nr:hypothetical protein [Thermococcus kodakarensis]WCN28647.1 hypothetical protein POG15_03085 [Thermococcus kodakarensis]WCN30945.1 hypothetical protein POG21_03085 [Thermococcus kodakarensis]BAD84791.1 hypothetical protein, conserved, containing leucine zipper motif [Thermococcus kodakarensis KOD1]